MTAEPILSATVLDIIQALGTWMFVVLGWLVVSDQQQYRELAKTASARIDLLRAQLNTIEEKSVEFHTNAYDPERARYLARALKTFSTEAAFLRKHKLIGLGTMTDSIVLRKAVTGFNFDKSSFVAQKMDSVVVESIEAIKDSLDRQLMDSSQKIVGTRRRLSESIKESLARALYS